jgi:hypothetical protein
MFTIGADLNNQRTSIGPRDSIRCMRATGIGLTAAAGDWRSTDQGGMRRGVTARPLIPAWNAAGRLQTLREPRLFA